jgi:hypothetical protein
MSFVLSQLMSPLARLRSDRREATRWAVTSVTCELPSVIGSALGIGPRSMTNWRGQDSSATFVEHLN